MDSTTITTNTKLRLKNTLDENKVAIVTFMTLKGVRTAQIVSDTGVDVSRETSL